MKMNQQEIWRRKSLCEKLLDRSDIGRPLLGLMWEPAILPIRSYVDRIDLSAPAQPDDISADEMCVQCDRIIGFTDALPQDFLYSVQASFNHLWLSAALGCPIRVTPATIWSEPAGVTLEAIAGGKLVVDHRWIDKLIQCHNQITGHICGRTAVAVPWLDGPMDLLVSLLGPEQTALALLDNPGLFEKAMDLLNDFVIRITGTLVLNTPAFADGYVSRMHIYTKEPSPTIMDDATWMTSRQNYQSLIYPFEKKMMGLFPGSVYHMHNTSTQIAGILAESPITAIQYTVDPNGPDWNTQKKAIIGMLDRKPVILSCWTLEDAERARKELPSAGLAITVVIGTLPDRSPEPRLLEEFAEWYNRSTR